MKRIKNAPELLEAFNKVVIEVAKERVPIWAHEMRIAEHFFIAGRDSLQDECESVKPKRKITDVFFEGKDTYVISDDGKLYHLVDDYKCWLPFPDLPQD